MQPEALHRMYTRQSAWFAGERNRLLRKAGIAGKHAVLDVGAGTGVMLPDLTRRAAGTVVGVDADCGALGLAAGRRVAAHAERLPFRQGQFDLVFAQMFFLWVTSLDRVLACLHDILVPGGHLIAAAEPDYGGAVTFPSVADDRIAAWAAELEAEGADPCVGRKLGTALESAGFAVECGVHPARPLAAARGDGTFAVPELSTPPAELEFCFIPYFHFLAVKNA